MKKLLLAASLLICNMSFASDLYFVNKSKNDLSVTYEFCNLDINNKYKMTCFGQVVSTIGGEIDGQDNFLKIPITQNSNRVHIYTAIEKQNDKVISSSDYKRETYPTCGATFEWEDSNKSKHKNNAFFIFDDMNGMPFIKCDSGQY